MNTKNTDLIKIQTGTAVPAFAPEDSHSTDAVPQSANEMPSADIASEDPAVPHSKARPQPAGEQPAADIPPECPAVLHSKGRPQPADEQPAADIVPEDIKFMKMALKQAEKAIAIGEVPIGAVIVCDGKVIARGYNRRNTDRTTLAHAEISCIRKACKKFGDWRLEGCTLYCTLEPCQMCAGAIVQSRIDRVVIGTTSPKSGCAGTLLNILQNPDFNHQAEVTRDVLRPECTEILQRFFKDLRRRNREQKKILRRQMAEENASQ